MPQLSNTSLNMVCNPFVSFLWVKPKLKFVTFAPAQTIGVKITLSCVLASASQRMQAGYTYLVGHCGDLPQLLITDSRKIRLNVT